MTTSLVIRPAISSDRSDLRRAIMELQDFERLRHATRLPGAQIADAYLQWMLGKAEANGTVLVAEQNGCFAGFATGWIEQNDNLAETADSNRFGLISDICVMPGFRGQRIATQLLDEMTQSLGRAGVARVRIAALANNSSARASYEYAGFIPYELLYEKEVDPAGLARSDRPDAGNRAATSEDAPGRTAQESL
jgi:ribosomal protein S18 acetylase RimI-like enzyme